MMWAVFGIMIAGRLVSLSVYQMTWRNGAAGDCLRAGAAFELLAKPRWWPLHLAMLWPVAGMSWDGMPALRIFAVTAAVLLALGAIGRLGCDERGRFFMADRALATALATCVAFSPAFLYPSVLAACCLQYTVASWRLGPGYSNLLGHEFMRGSLCVASAALAAAGWTGGIGESAMLAAVIAWQASSYVNHALAKCALGPRWHSWIRENRAQCLVVNAWLRGWRTGRNREAVLSFAGFVERWRVAPCTAAWCIEISWLLPLADSRLACAILLATLVFHAAVLWLTGLLAWHYVANHLALLALIAAGMADGVFGMDHWLGALAGMIIAAPWVGWVRGRMLKECQQNGRPRRWALLGDSADHLMAWWDTPLMRMFCYTVTSASGRVFSLPVTRLSPHDTALTDIHTHMMILGMHDGLDPEIPTDRKLAPTGVWGLVIDRAVRDFLYRAMDGADELPSVWSVPPEPSRRSGHEASRNSAIKPLQAMFVAMNGLTGRRWYKFMMRRPHFPGEDLVPDICPLVSPPLPEFRFDERIATVSLWRVRTFYDGETMSLVSHAKVADIHVGEIE